MSNMIFEPKGFVPTNKINVPYNGTSFMALPPEVRLMIYAYLKVDRTKNKASPLFNRCPKERPARYSLPDTRTDVERCRPGFSTSQSFPLSVLVLNKTIFAEASHLFYKDMNWHFFLARTRDGYRTEPINIRFPLTDYIQHITLNLVFGSPTSDCRTVCDMEIICKTFAKMPALKQVDLRIHKLCGSFRYYRADSSFLECVEVLPKNCTWKLVSPVGLTSVNGQWIHIGLTGLNVQGIYHENRLFKTGLEEILGREIPVEVERVPSFYPDWVHLKPALW
ncbi:hypothetical protein MMC10_010466 [Thelotrema lepadinum]|nr:hypothetical protein [Thelotrema lepadinum]